MLLYLHTSFVGDCYVYSLLYPVCQLHRVNGVVPKEDL